MRKRRRGEAEREEEEGQWERDRKFHSLKQGEERGPEEGSLWKQTSEVFSDNRKNDYSMKKLYFCI